MADIPDLKDARLRYSNKPIRFVSISIDKDRSVWENAMRQLEIPWEQLLISSTPDYEFLKRAFQHRSFPAVFIVNSNGRIRRSLDMEDFDRVLAGLSGGLPNRPYQSQVSFSSGTGSIKPGRDITASPNPVVSDPVSTDEARTTPTGDINDGWLMHTVKTGETLFSLYRKYGVKVAEIKSNNSLSSNTIKVGQVLKIRPADP